MIIIGEKLTVPFLPWEKAIAERNEEGSKKSQRNREAAGATYIDVCVSVEEEIELTP